MRGWLNYFLFLFEYIFAVAWYYGCGAVLVYRGVSFLSSICQVILITIIIIFTCLAITSDNEVNAYEK